MLVPNLCPGDVAVMVEGKPSTWTTVGAAVLYLPAYGTDFNLIEMIFSRVKRQLRDAAARIIDTLHKVIGDALTAVTRADIAN